MSYKVYLGGKPSQPPLPHCRGDEGVGGLEEKEGELVVLVLVSGWGWLGEGEGRHTEVISAGLYKCVR